MSPLPPPPGLFRAAGANPCYLAAFRRADRTFGGGRLPSVDLVGLAEDETGERT